MQVCFKLTENYLTLFILTYLLYNNYDSYHDNYKRYQC